MADFLSAESEAQLIGEIPDNPEAFRMLYRHYFPRIYAYVAYRTGTKQDSEDVVSEIFLKVVRALPRFEYRGAGSFAGWLFRIAHNEVNLFYRRQSRQRGIIALDDIPEIRSDHLTPDEVLLQRERFEELRRDINSLSPRRQEILTLRFFGGLRNQEIAGVLNLDERTVASHISRGLKDLKKKLIAQEEAAHDFQTA